MSKRADINAALLKETGKAPPMRAFVHLHTHSAYSLLEGALPLKDILARTKEDAQPAVAVTDRNNLFGALEFSQKALGEGIQPIIGCKLEVALEPAEAAAPAFGSNQQAMRAHPTMIFLVMNATGYDNLTRLASLAHMEGAKVSRAHVTVEQVAELSDG
ncbi:MAG: PHP domain-containing protein, partial [Pseudomonadota bacterium]